HSERGELVLGQIHPPELPVLADVADDVDQLERDPERLGPSYVVRSVHRDTRDADGAGDLRAVVPQLFEVRVTRLLQVLEAAGDEGMQRAAGNREALTSIRQRDGHRVVAGRAGEP